MLKGQYYCVGSWYLSERYILATQRLIEKFVEHSIGFPNSALYIDKCAV